MAHPRVEQLRFARSEFVRGLEGVTDEEARRRILPMNCISWMIGHLANQEYRYWELRAHGRDPMPDIKDMAPYGKPGSTPALDEALDAWRAVTALVDPYLDTLTTASLDERYIIDGQAIGESVGTLLQRVTYHYWFHTGESQVVRQLLGHTDLPEYVGDFTEAAAYRAEH